jgi:hypothetical protein
MAKRSVPYELTDESLRKVVNNVADLIDENGSGSTGNNARLDLIVAWLTTATQRLDTIVTATSQDSDFGASVARGLVPGSSVISLTGHVPNVDAAGPPQDLWEGDGEVVLPSVASAIEIVSSSAADTALGTGARTVRVSGLNAALLPISQVVPLNGVTPVLLATAYRRINDVRVVTAGSGEKNAGRITVRVVAGAEQSIIDTGDGVAHRAAYAVPAGFDAFITHASVGVLDQASIESAEVVVYTRDFVNGGAWIKQAEFFVSSSGSSGGFGDSRYPRSVPSGHDVRVTVIETGPTSTIAVTSNLQLLLVAQ